MPEFTELQGNLKVADVQAPDGALMRQLIIQVSPERVYSITMPADIANKIGLGLQGKGVIQAPANAIPNLPPGGRAR